jgi:hypothetical protein
VCIYRNALFTSLIHSKSDSYRDSLTYSYPQQLYHAPRTEDTWQVR